MRRTYEPKPDKKGDVSYIFQSGVVSKNVLITFFLPLSSGFSYLMKALCFMLAIITPF